MAQNYSNLMGSALKNKANPDPLSKLKGPMSVPSMIPKPNNGLGMENASYAPGYSAPDPRVTASNQGLLSGQAGYTPPTPNAPIKKVVVNNPMGGSHEVHYDTSVKNPGDNSQLTQATPSQEAFLHGDQSQSKGPDNSYSGLVNQVVGATGNNAALGANAQDIAKQAGQQISDIGQKGALAGNSFRTFGTTPVGLGNQAIINQSTAEQQQAIAQGANMALSGNQQALSAQNQTQSGLLGAAGLAQPQVGAYGQTYYNPLTGTTSGGSQGSVSPSDPFYKTLQSYADLYASGQQAGIPSSITGNPVLNAQLLQMVKEKNPDFNVNSAAANAQAQGTQAATVEGYKSAYQVSQNLQSQLSQLIQGAGINPNDLNAVNSGLQKIASNTSSPQYKTFENLVTDLSNSYAQILTPTGSNPTDYKTQLATSMIDSTAKGESLLQVIQGLDAQARAKIAGTQTASGRANGGGTSGPLTWGNI